VKPVSIFIRYSEYNQVLDKVAVLSVEDHLVFKDGPENFRTVAGTLVKFSLLTAASPLIGLARVVRSVAFACAGDFSRSGREFVGALSIPVVAGGCLLGTLASSVAFLIDKQKISLTVQMKRTYAYFEAWVNGVDLQSEHLPSFSDRVSMPMGVIGNGKGVHKYVWTTAPCMQPVLEKGFSKYGGLFDVQRMQKIFPLISVLGVHREGARVVLQSVYKDEHSHVVLWNGACEHARSSMTCCCCFRVETAYDRVLCFEVGQGNCTSMLNHEDNCGFVFCSAGCVGVCCCTERNNLVAVNTCLA
jgi:hypothetical protein